MSDDQQPEPAAAPETLVAWLRDNAAGTSFVAALRVSGRRLDDADIEAAAALVAGDSVLVSRAAEFIKASEGAPSVVRAVALQFGQKLLGREYAPLAEWLRAEHLTAEEDLRSLGSVLAPHLRSKDSKSKRRAELLMGIGLAVFMAKRRLQPECVLDVIGDAYGLPRAESSSDGRPERAVSTLIAKSKPRQLLQYAAVARLLEQRVRRADAEQRRELARATQAEQRAAELQAQLLASEEAKRCLEGQVKGLEERLSQANSRIEGIQTVGAHDVAGLRARFRRVLGEDIRSLAGDARDALEIEPPRPDFAKIYLADVLEKIEGEIRWLNERSD